MTEKHRNPKPNVEVRSITPLTNTSQQQSRKNFLPRVFRPYILKFPHLNTSHFKPLDLLLPQVQPSSSTNALLSPQSQRRRTAQTESAKRNAKVLAEAHARLTLANFQDGRVQ